VHFLVGGCAFLIEPLGRWGAAAFAAAALLYNAGIAPGLGLDRSYRREGEGVWGGLTTYPLSVLLLIVLSPRLEIAAGAWAVLAGLDPVAAAVGTRLPRPAAPFNPRKSLWGMAAGALAGTCLCAAVLLWMGAPRALLPALSAGALGAVAEALPVRGDDNLRLAAAAALALLPWFL
jgi:dolichol kinase